MIGLIEEKYVRGRGVIFLTGVYERI